MTDFNFLKEQGGPEIVNIEELLDNQETYRGLSNDSKVELFKDYLFLKIRSNPWFDRSNEEALYDEINAGINSLEDVLTAIAENKSLGSDCLEELNSSFMTDSFVGVHGKPMLDVEDNRNQYIKSIEKNTTKAFHENYRLGKVEAAAESMKDSDIKLAKTIEELDGASKKVDIDMRFNS